MDSQQLSCIDWLAAQGAVFTLLHPQSKRPCHKAWQAKPRSAAMAQRHSLRGGNIGVLVGEPSSGIVCLDFDRNFPEVCHYFPELAAVCIIRTNAPERGKVLFRIDAPLPNRVWKPGGERRPQIELLASRKVAVVPPSLHPTQVYYKLKITDVIPPLSLEYLQSVWYAFTNESLRTVVDQSFFRRAPVLVPADEQDKVSRVKARWPTALEVFAHFGRAQTIVRQSSNDLRLLGNGGLLVGCPDSGYSWRWYCFAEEVGGDQIDAAGYCLFGRRWSRYNPSLFTQVLQEMLGE